MNRYQLVILITLLGLETAQLYAQEPISRMDSLLYRAAQSTGYYTPHPISDPQLLERAIQHLGNPSPLVEYLKTEVHSTTPSVGTYRLLLPLTLRFDLWDKSGRQVDHLGISPDSLKLFTPKNPSPLQGSVRGLIPRALSTELELGNTLYHSLQRSCLDRFAYLPPTSGERSSLKLASHSDLGQSFGTHQIQTQRLDQVVQNMRIQEIEQRYWIPSFESSIQLSQSHVSDNWYKGGSSNLNLYMRTYGAMTYLRGKIKWKNELEDKLSLYSMDKSEGASGRGYRVADDQIRLRSNFGLKAISGWYYTLDAEARSQLLTTYKGDTNEVQSAPLSPLTVNIGLGMRFDLISKSRRIYKRKLTLAMNVAPISYTYRSTIRDDIDLARHGLTPHKLYYHRIGSTLRASMQWDINMNVSWTTRLYFNTSYTNIEAEWENTLDMKIGRYLSTRINLQLRYDDAARPSNGWNKYLQYNELLSFGFSYKL